MRFVLPVAAVAALAQPVAAADLHFCWKGANGYTMTGAMTVPDSKLYSAVLTEADVTRFKIAGYQHGALIGTWDLDDRDKNATWHLRFDPVSMSFLTGGIFASTRSQGWNADGQVDNCGSDGFGFNSGNFAQDICVNGSYISDSSIAPETPLTASLSPVSPTCAVVQSLSKR